MDLSDAVIRASRRHPGGFTSDDVWALLPSMGIHPPTNPSSLGIAFVHAKNTGLITFTGRYRASTRRESKARHVRVWVRT